MRLKKGLFLASLLSMAPAAFAATSWPLTIENCGVTQTFAQPPQRVVTVGQHETELLLALGLEKTIAATSVWFGELPAPLADAGKNLPRLTENSPSFEAVVGQKPELVLAQYHWHIGPQGEVGTREQFASLGINTWISPADCTDKAVTETSNADGARSAPFSLAEITREVTDLATIFDVSARGEQLNRALTERIEKARARVSAKPLRVVFWFSSSRLNGDPWVAGNYGAPGWISRTLGLKNIIDSHDEWPAVTWEHIARSQPDVIVIAEMSRRLYPADDVAVKEAFLRSDPVTKNMPAVRNNHIIVVPAMSLNPSLRNVDAVELISDRLASFRDEQ
ncbi:ABC transporter substrate-binding protein [Enterobacter hormaechei]|uniref:ABC transporter substrate-binding protein n=1 Tax=Enterobacter hormaechei TaxID=158836 RepID=UPI0020B75683|nr:ABC transporter substrate-binding protein [Enterobacter hormaechei]MCP3814686.1 ABC transporter substrate-binding protein [Enterobacter hormaechei]MCP3823515.1 ABC transporter substrate-binding protein [Enterobacter hormaechei]MCW4624828.1 ABC transporter substrate-binding protein [Enterobacter hormaechei]HAZ0554700.1 ABC transporter substrate-binding protein [Enterobacter hormaechei]